MRFLIDGYNLLHQSDLLWSGRGANWLEKARERLLRAIGEHLDASQLVNVTVVFDRHSKKPIEAEQRISSGIRVMYAVDHPEADDLIEMLILKHPHPKNLLVVSSDHRLQTAARRRKAKFSDSDVWYECLVDGKHRDRSDVKPLAKPQVDVTDDELSKWLGDFDADTLAAEIREVQELPAIEEHEPIRERPKNDLEKEGYNPFPDGYGEDLI